MASSASILNAFIVFVADSRGKPSELIEGPDHPARHSGGHDPRGDRPGDDAPGADRRTVANRHNRQDDRPTADPDAIADRHWQSHFPARGPGDRVDRVRGDVDVDPRAQLKLAREHPGLLVG
jgi:hypothetical protein